MQEHFEEVAAHTPCPGCTLQRMVDLDTGDIILLEPAAIPSHPFCTIDTPAVVPHRRVVYEPYRIRHLARSRPGKVGIPKTRVDIVSVFFPQSPVIEVMSRNSAAVWVLPHFRLQSYQVIDLDLSTEALTLLPFTAPHTASTANNVEAKDSPHVAASDSKNSASAAATAASATEEQHVGVPSCGVAGDRPDDQCCDQEGERDTETVHVAAAAVAPAHVPEDDSEPREDLTLPTARNPELSKKILRYIDLLLPDVHTGARNRPGRAKTHSSSKVSDDDEESASDPVLASLARRVASGIEFDVVVDVAAFGERAEVVAVRAMPSRSE